MKNIFLFFFIVFSNFSFSQQIYNSLIEFNFSENFYNFNETYSEYLLMNDKESFYFYYKGKLDFEKASQNFQLDYSNTRLKFDLENNRFLELKKYVGKNIYYLIDNVPKIIWEITKEKKKILGYNCYGAIGEFRGRKYFVWFTYEIPYSFGPWKLNGLPGVILEAKDNLGYFNYSARRIVLNNSFSIPSLLEKEFYSNRNTTLYKDFIEIQNNYLSDLRNKVKANRPKGTVFREDPDVRDLLQEKSFEWKETKKP